jgi:hypothetical protein
MKLPDSLGGRKMMDKFFFIVLLFLNFEVCEVVWKGFGTLHRSLLNGNVGYDIARLQ